MSTNSVYSGIIAQLPASVVGDELQNLTAIFNALQNMYDSVQSAASTANYVVIMSVVLVAAEALERGAFVTVNSSGQLIAATQQSLLGYIEQSVKVSSSVSVIMEGLVANKNWSLTPGTTYYLGANNTLVTVWQLSEIYNAFSAIYSLHIRVGVAVTTNSLLISPAILGIAQAPTFV